MAPSQSGRTRRAFLAGAGAAGATALAGCTQGSNGSGGTTDDGDALSGNISITGSSTVYPLSARMTTLFKEEHGEVTFSSSKTGSGAGFSNFFCQGDSMINNASRPISAEETEQCDANGVDPVELRVATDAVTVIINPDNSFASCMTLDELAQIWRPDEPAQTWQDVNEEWPDEEIELFGAASTSGTFDFFTESVVGEEGASRTDYNATENDNQIVAGVQQNEYAMGYLGYAYFDQSRDAVDALEVDGGDGCVAPSLETAKSGEYPLSRPLFTYPSTSALAKERVAEFCRFWLEKSTSDEIVAGDVGYVPNTPETRDAQLETLNAAIDEASG